MVLSALVIFTFVFTLAMHEIAENPFNLLDIHTLSGQIALWLMLAHAIWVTRIIRKGTNSQRSKFHRYSIFVWLIWLIPYLGGMFLGMQ
ncbi:MAG: TIGR03987 family protein [Prolixibacteraceae bacterium]|jgi:uncharacterized repeat protein (TIGR03987 family)|nr:TIGR03987 family protein [Prolixibacteraceae bacterium]MBT6004657.1 TIGR03987 family protein [Prolixibacteraceae bacterium]MBT6765981.1 TIGR03987 family protein [Prolixibacteraceae bacterium]MBT6996963.1 TIGR03987 family protein [Prolixibacteraceae bacterium]MBT7395373.1 TIGR03987 family protein [Prolixibacteraceae bacterium]